jgi:hypothetical protein
MSVAALLSGALVWGLIWYPFRELNLVGVDGVLATMLTYLLALAMFTGTLLKRLRILGRAGRRLQQAAGGLLVVMGLLMVTGQLEVIAFWLIETFPSLSTIG